MDGIIEQSLKDSESRYRRLFEAAQDGILILDARTGMIEDVNPYLIKMLGYSREEFEKKKLWEVGAFRDIEASQQAFEALQENEYIRYDDLPLKAKDGRLIQVEFVSNVYQVGNEMVIQCNIRDITVRKRAEEAEQTSKRIIEGIIDAIPARVFWKDKNLVYLGCNALFAHDAGFTDPKDIIGKDDYQMVWQDQAESYRRDDRQVIESGNSKLDIEEPQTNSSGNTITLLTNKVPLRSSRGQIVGVLGTYMDITERNRAEEALHESEERYRLLMETLPDGVVVHSQGQVIFANPASATIIGPASPADLIGKPVIEYVHPASRELALKRIQQSISEGVPIVAGEEKFVRLDGTPIDVQVSGIPLSYDGKPAMLTVFNDITARKRTEEALRSSEENYRTLVDEVNDGFYVADADGAFTFANPALAHIYGVENPQVLMGRKFIDFISPEILVQLSQEERGTMHTARAPEVINGQIVRPDGTRAYIEVKPVSILKGKQIVGSRGVVRDVSERKRAETALQESEEEYRSLFENSITGISQALPDGRLIRANNAYAQMYGYASPEETIADVNHIGRLYANPKDREDVLRILADSGIMEPREMTVVRRDGTPFIVLVGAREIRDSKGNLRCFQAEHTDITERKRSEERIQRQLEHLTSLSSIDRVISANFDLKLSLSEILNHVTKELGVDAADILILNSSLNMLEYGAERGFRINAVRKVQIRLGESYAGRVTRGRKLVQIPNLKDEPENPLLSSNWMGEGFVCYFGEPLIIKGQVKGVLEIFHRSALEPDAEWFDFLNSLAGQTAIAIENSTLFESLQRSNSDLFLAYDATIEGWSQALDLRDKETEGHSRRVTEMTVKLARLFGLSETDLVQVRWGALLHDIGKMGVPDGILLKAGPLTDEEWVAMKKHPTFAYEMLAPIDYLRQALDIPYCHHEKWDGSGYPRGLKGTQIPLVARIFAVVDVWDALKSDRPYRPAWTEKDALKHVRSLSGTHFDPQVVDAFIRLPD